jgi:hypothetical protein
MPLCLKEKSKMKKCTVLILLISLFLNLRTWSQVPLTSPEEYLGYKLGTAFTPHYKVTAYLEKISDQTSKAIFRDYGETYEGRPLSVLFISSEENIENLENIRLNNLRKAGELPGEPNEDGKIIVWLSYNVHGDEASSTEAALATVHKLLSGGDDVNRWLENTVVIIDPCVNPDGRDRYVHWYKENRSNILLTNPIGTAHVQSWPGARSNHYLFDLNRDWTWLSQVESKSRIILYNEWLPQIHVDFHEQSYNSPYYFAPAAQPYHSLITEWQKEFQVEIGKNHAKYFNENNWLYFTKERFDLFYPGYGDTYPTFNGAIGMTYEQAGSGRAGLGIKTETGDTLTLLDRLTHHYTTSISTIEISSDNAVDLEKNYIEFFMNAHKPVADGFNTFIVKSRNGNKRIRKLIELLDHHRIKYGQLNNSKSTKGFDFHMNRNLPITIESSDLLIPVQQAKSTLLRVLFEPVSTLVDSMTYDITSWSIPYAFGLETYATDQVINFNKEGFVDQPMTDLTPKEKSYGFAFTRNAISDIRVLSELLLHGMNVRTNYTALTMQGISFPAGSFFILMGDNKNFKGNTLGIMTEISEQYELDIIPLSSGFSDDGPDLGSSKLKLLDNQLNVGVLYGENVWSNNVGEVWHLFEQDLQYPLIRLNTSYFSGIDLNDMDVIIIPEGFYGSILDEDQLKKLNNWVLNGGRLVVIGRALRYFADKDLFNLKQYLDEEEKEEIEKLQTDPDYLRKYAEDERLYIKNKIYGGIYKTRLDNSHPIGFGYPEYYFTLKTVDNRYSVLDKGWNVATISGSQDKVSGFSGSSSQAKTYKALIVGMEDKGAGEVVYFVDNPLFRSFWENGKLMFSNAIFMP